MFSRIGDFLLGQWLWSITWDWYHIPINIAVSCLLFKLALRLNIIPSVLIAFLANIYSFIVFGLFAFIVLYYLFGIDFTPEQASFMVAQPLHACIYLGLIYATIQMSAFALLQIWYKTNYWEMVSLAFLSNLVTALLVNSMVANPLL